MTKWSNWSGGVEFAPKEIARPQTEQELQEVVRSAAQAGSVVRAVGAGHSSSPLVETSGPLVSLEKLTGIEAVDPAAGTATIRPGTPLHEASPLLREHGVDFENLGDVDTQHVAGAFSTGTHGTGPAFPILGANIRSARLVTATGDIREVDEADPDLLSAIQLSLGALGIFTALTINVIPAKQLIRREWCVHIDECLAHFDDLIARNRNFDFYWYPRRDEAKLRTHNPIDADPGMTIPGHDLEEEQSWVGDILTSNRELRFHEMEYFFPRENGIACFKAVRDRMKEVHRQNVGWRVLVRTVAPDTTLLGPGACSESITVAVHQNVGLPYQEFFAEIEPIFLRYGGRPHWAKVHNLGARQLRDRIPGWARFREIRGELDPAGVFLNPYLHHLFEAA